MKLLRLSPNEQAALTKARDVMLKILTEQRVKGSSREADALRHALYDGEALIRRIDALAALPA
jgi:hypothetical protein